MIGRPLMTGLSAGLTAGAMAFGISRKAQRGKRKLKARAGKALRSVGDLMDELSDMLR